MTSNYKRAINNEKGAPVVRAYHRSQYNWDINTFNRIDVATIGRVKKTLKMRILMCFAVHLKIIHEWLPNNHMYQHIMGISQCPDYEAPDETIDHMMH